MEWVKNRFINWPHNNEVISEFFSDIDEPIEMWGLEKIEKYHIFSLNKLINFVYENNEYYRNKITECGSTIKDEFSMNGFRKLGFTEKDELRKNPYLILSVDREKISQIHLSTGTTGGESIYIMYTWEDLFINDLSAEMPILVPSRINDVVANALPYEMSSAGLSFHRIIQESMQACVIPVGKGGAHSDPQKTVKILRDMQVNVIITSPSYAMHLADEAEKIGLEFGKDINIEKMWLTGEGCSDAFRKRIEKIWKTNALFYYGSLECGPIGIECNCKNGYHIPGGHVYVEIIDKETGENLSPGEIGEIVVTTLLREGAPLIRYKTQDLGYIEDFECSCGIKFQRLFLRGREADQINIGGESYSPYYLEEHLMRIPEVGNNYQFIVYDDYLLIEVEVNKSIGNIKNEEIESMISSRLEYACGIPNQVKIVKKRAYSGSKSIRVINKQLD